MFHPRAPHAAALAAALLVAAAALLCSAPGRARDGGLRRYLNKNRVLLIFAPSASDPRWRLQNRLLAGSRAALADRDLVRIDALQAGGDAASAALRARYHVAAGSFRALLVGKDGHVAYASSAPVAPADLDRRIDRMPMRRDEMRRKGELTPPALRHRAGRALDGVPTA